VLSIRFDGNVIEIQKDDQPVFRRIFGLHSVQDGITNGGESERSAHGLRVQMGCPLYTAGVLIIIYYGVVHLEVSVEGFHCWLARK
jgi:hypothetical protein